MNGEEIKQAVRHHYGKVAVEESSCCGSSCGCRSDESETLIAPMNDTDREIIETADLGLGCGAPTRFAGLKERMTVLDLGSGAGIDVFLAAKQVGPTGRVIGLDMTEEMIDRAEQNKAKLGISNAEFRKGEIEDMPIESGSIDHVLSNCVLNLVPDKRKAFGEIHRVLKGGGKFTISDIVTLGAIPDEERNDPMLWCGCVAGAVEKSDYLSLIRATGFRNVEVTTENEYPGQRSFKILSITVTGEK